MKIYALDIETAPAQVFTFGFFKTTISVDQVIEDPRMLCIVAQDYDKRGKRPEFYAEWLTGGHDRMVREAWRILDTADVIVHYNGKRFDVPWLNTEFKKLGLNPPSPYKQVDLFQASKKFYVPSRKLQYVSTRLAETGGKVQHTGFKLWRDLLIGSKAEQRAARKLMREYNEGDVTILWDVFEEFRPWISLPNRQIYPGNGVEDCPKCGSGSVTKQGSAFTAQSRFQRYKCGDCGGWFRGTRALDRATLVEVTA